jgi:hypothetical protein
MGERENRDAADALWTALAASDWAAAADLLHADFVQEWPQSKERISRSTETFPAGCPR